MLSSSRRAWSSVSTGVFPRLITCFGPRTACAGFTASTWPMMSQSNSMRMAARCCFTGGLAAVACSVSIYAGDVQRLDVGEFADAVLLDPAIKVAHGPVIGHAGILIADLSCKEPEEAPGRVIAGASDHRLHGDYAPRRRHPNRQRGFDYGRHVPPLRAHGDTL